MPYWDKERQQWQGIVRYKRLKKKRAFKVKRDATAWEVQLRKDLQAQETQKTSKTATATDLLSFFNRYLDDAELRFSKKTFVEKRTLCRKLIKRWGNPPVDEITPEMIQKYLSQRAKHGSANLHNKDRKNLNAVWNWGVGVLGLKANFVACIKELPHNRLPQYTPSTEDVLRVIAVANREERIFLNCYLQTGARRSEIFAWNWNDDINFERREVRLGTRKTRDGSMSYEWLPMSDKLYDELWSWWQNRPIKDATHVFVSTSNRHYGLPFTTRHQFLRGLCKRAGVKSFGFHALRRYVASYLADTRKVSAKTIQRILRHKNLATTERYIHNINNDLAGTMNLLGENGPQDGPQKTAEG
jgi:integrase